MGRVPVENSNVQIIQAPKPELPILGNSSDISKRADTVLVTAESSQSVIFQQSQVWSRSIAWGIMGLIVVLVSWAALARIDEAIPADGTIEPLDDARKIQAPSSGVVQQIYVKNGDRVKAGDLLLRLEATVPKSQLTALQSTKDSLAAENRFYRAQLNLSSAKDTNIAGLHIPPEVLALTKSRNALVAENQLYRSEMSGKDIASLTINQQNRLQSSQNELNSRLTVGKLEIGQVQKQLSANRLRRQGLVNQLDGIKSNIASITAEIVSGQEGVTTSRSQIDRQLSQNQSRIISSKKTLNINQGILTDLRPAAAAGAIASTQVKQQEQEVIRRASELEQQHQEQSRLQLEKERLTSTSKADTQRQQQRIQEQRQLIKQHQSEIDQLPEEHSRLQLSASQGAVKLDNNLALNRKDPTGCGFF
jgi:hemolysin D